MGIIAFEDVVDGLLLAAEKGKVGERYILNSLNISLKDLWALIDTAIGKASKERIVLSHKLEKPLVFLTSILESVFGRKAGIEPGTIRMVWNNRIFTSQKAMNELNWRPKYNNPDAFIELFSKVKSFYIQEGLL
jgi:dihydroflavonol-4-reductase